MFGPVEAAPKHPGGRPKFNKVEEYQEFVDYCLGVGVDIAEIAKAVGVSQPTLRHYFSGSPAWQSRRATWRNMKRPRATVAQND